MNALLIIAPGMLLVLGLILAGLAFRPEYPRLDDALASLADADEAEPAAEPAAGERLGAWWLRHRRGRVSPTTERALELKGRTVGAHYTAKVAGLLAGFGLPIVAGLVGGLLAGLDAAVPLVLSLVGAAAGFVLPDLLLRGKGATLTADATESLLTYFDLVTLERMANQSATQSLHAAAAVSDATVFVQVRAALERARLEQRMPYAELKSLGQRLALPALVDVADVMRLDESGAALSGTLRARVKELRDHHLTERKVAATEVSERLTIFMVVPSLVFGLIFLAPPLLRLVSS